MILLTLAVLLPTLAFIVFSLPPVHNKIRTTTEEALTELLGAEVTIRDLSIKPFSRATLLDVAIVMEGDTVAKIERLGAGISLYPLIKKGSIVADYAEIIGLDVKLTRNSANEPLNIQPIIDRLKGDDDKKEPISFDARINTVVIRNSSFSYDVIANDSTPNIFNPSHIKVNGFRADINVPKLTNGTYHVNLRRLAFHEQSGFDLNNLQAHLLFSPDSIGWSDLEIKLPTSSYHVADAGLPLKDSDILQAITDNSVSLKIDGDTYLPDFAPFLPELDDLDMEIMTRLKASGSLNKININEINLADKEGDFSINIADAEVHDFDNIEDFTYNINRFSVHAGGPLSSRLQRNGLLKFKKPEIIKELAIIGSAKGDAYHGDINGAASLNDGSLKIKGNYRRQSLCSPTTLKASATAKGFNLATILNNPDLGILTADIEATATIDKQLIDANGKVSAAEFTYLGYSYDQLSATASYNDGDLVGDITLTDVAANIACFAKGSLKPGAEFLLAEVKANDIDLHTLQLTDKFEGHKLSANATIDLKGFNSDITGRADLSNIKFKNPNNDGIAIDSLIITREPEWLTVSSDYINGEIVGPHDFTSIGPIASDIFLQALSTLDKRNEETKRNLKYAKTNKFRYNFTVNQIEDIAQFFNLPISVIYPMTIEGSFDSERSYAHFDIDAPYLRQGRKVIENSSVTGILDGQKRIDNIYLTTDMPTKDGLMTVTMAASGHDNKITTDIGWKIDRQKAYNGSVSLSGTIATDDLQRPIFDVNLHRSSIVFNDSVWNVNPAHIAIDGDMTINIDNIEVSRANQFVKIGGNVSTDPADTLKVDILNFNLDYLFETLAIDAVMLGGDATGQVYASSLLSPEPHIQTEGIHVSNISYNDCVFGDAIVKSHWDIDEKAVILNGLISQPDNRTSNILGKIYPIDSKLDLDITADNIPTDFLDKYMKAFATDISGHATGHVRLWGTFKDIDLVGEVFARDFKLKLIPTNTYFIATDSIKFNPGRIELDNITVYDILGNTANLNGLVTHEYFRNPTFNLDITDAQNMLVYEETSRDNPDWYGKVFANGGAHVDGKPELIKIEVDATTAPGSTFSFVLSQLEVADNYTFLSFRDRNKPQVVEEKPIEDSNMRLVNRIKAMSKQDGNTSKSDFEIEFRVDVTPQAEIDLVMDPIAGDKIRSNGSGNVRMVYKSHDNDIQMFGNYTLERGTYNFTLQDIIIKDFTIDEGSTIAFTGDPLAARLDIQAYYALNANLSDLDESFLQDKDLNRTNVPVRAILKVAGDIRQPDISFDLAFPSLTSDTDRKVRSIISTDEMMNRQIIYLLALNRFYTPDYMGSTTKGNELFSVASSTITSQLSNILGHLSENWAISPNLRSDRGDFSDVEVDVALSSRLLNNRLLLNGNFGYRDKSLNNNQFVGDFEIEYLLNRPGTIRLKAYSHSNDENYYVRTADTTQGVGIMFKRDFDDIFSFLRRKPAKSAAMHTVGPTDSIDAPADSVAVPTNTNAVPADSIALPVSPVVSDSISVDTSPIEASTADTLIQFR